MEVGKHAVCAVSNVVSEAAHTCALVRFFSPEHPHGT